MSEDFWENNEQTMPKRSSNVSKETKLDNELKSSPIQTIPKEIPLKRNTTIYLKGKTLDLIQTIIDQGKRSGYKVNASKFVRYAVKKIAQDKSLTEDFFRKCNEEL